MLEAINAARGQEVFTLTMILDDPTVESKNVAGHEMSGSEDADGLGMIAASRKSKCRWLPARRHGDPGTTGRPEPSRPVKSLSTGINRWQFWSTKSTRISRLSEHGEASG